MIYLILFLEFLKIGAFTFGGGYAMIAVIREAVLEYGWLTEAELLSFIAIAESTPGPIAVNIATFVGYSQGGVLGAVLATLGVVLPSFIVILVISMFISNLIKYKGVDAFLSGVRPAVVAMILATALTIALSKLLSFGKIGDALAPDLGGIVILTVLFALHTGYKHYKKKRLSPIVMILVSAVLGMLIYS